MDQDIENIINEIIKNPSKTLSVENNKLIQTSSKNLSNDNKNEVIEFLQNHQLEIQEVFNIMYLEGKEVIKFQDYINKLCSSTGTPNFLREFTSNWTSILQSQDVEIKFFPGTHDSGANTIDFSHRPAHMNNLGPKILYSLVKLPGIKTIVKNWTINQEHSIFEQLENGIRLFDFRLGKSSDGTLYLTHTFLTTPFDEVVEQLKSFIEKHPNEIIKINLKNDYAYRKVIAQEDIDNTKNKILEISKSYNGVTLLKNNTELWPNKTKISEVEEYINNQSFDNGTYLSLNTTPNGIAIFKKLFSSNLIENGKEIQKELGDKVINDISNKNALGIIADSPTPEFIQKSIYSNIVLANKELLNTDDKKEESLMVFEDDSTTQMVEQDTQETELEGNIIQSSEEITS